MNAITEFPLNTAEQPITISEAIEAMRHFECQQNPEELAKVCELIRGKHSLLEIGSNFGGSLWRMAEVLAPASKVVSLDLPEQKHRFVDPIHSLKVNCQKIADWGHDVRLFIGDSHNPLIRKLIEEEGPYDFIFVDGDHSYEGVKKDWEYYHSMTKMIGFHDTSGGTEGCVKFWTELKAEGKYRTQEFDIPQFLPITTQWMKLGIGVVFLEE